jgi:hypothetical protein
VRRVAVRDIVAKNEDCFPKTGMRIISCSLELLLLLLNTVTSHGILLLCSVKNLTLLPTTPFPKCNVPLTVGRLSTLTLPTEYPTKASNIRERERKGGSHIVHDALGSSI